MYGLVNRAIEGLVSDQFGPAKWDEIKDHAKVTQCPFLSMRSYPDAITYDLVQSASVILGIDMASILRAFGEHWVLFTADQGYGRLLDHCGQTLREFLLNLDSLHTRVGMVFPDLQPPEFRSSEQADSSIRLEYYSNRAGLSPMVAGLLAGLSKRFETPIRLEQLPAEAAGSSQAVFTIHFLD